jgi:hypothetical protein
VSFNYSSFKYRAELERRAYEYLGNETARDHATMLQALVAAEGDEVKAKAKYYELRFRQMEESGALVPFALTILSERGDICSLCLDGKNGRRVELPSVGPWSWVHVSCMSDLRASNASKAEQMLPLHDFPADLCAYCYCTTIGEYAAIALYKGQQLRVHYSHEGTWDEASQRECPVCGNSYKKHFWSSEDMTVLRQLEGGELRMIRCHKECLQTLTERLTRG